MADWNALERLRTRFLEQKKGEGVYWQDENDLSNYHAFFAERIGWKWDNALKEARLRGFQPCGKRLLDWGCGSGIATLRALANWGSEGIEQVLLWDHSALACRFAQKTIREAYPNIAVDIASGPGSWDCLKDTIVLVSHTLNELTSEMRNTLSEQIAHAAQILFVEAGNHETSHLLAMQRNELKENFDIVAPCTHCETCPIQSEGNRHHWCHFFGKPPTEAFTEGDWASFAAMMEIDLRSLPYSYLILNHKRLSQANAPAKAARLIGRPRQFKGYTRLLSCDASGLHDFEVQKRDDKALWKSLKKGKDGSLYQWTEVQDDRIKSGSACDKDI